LIGRAIIAFSDGRRRRFTRRERNHVPGRGDGCMEGPGPDRRFVRLPAVRFRRHPGEGFAEDRGKAVIRRDPGLLRHCDGGRDKARGHLHQSGFCPHGPASSAADARLSPAGITDSLPASGMVAKNPTERTLVMNISPPGTLPPLPPDRADVLMDKAEEMEAAFLAEMLAHSGLGERQGSFGGGAGEAQFASFLRQEQARLMVGTGGIGLAEVIFRTMVEAPHGTP
jgi:peptidoglycan hydrolase FlgJ